MKPENKSVAIGPSNFALTLRPLDLLLVAVLTAAVFVPNLYGRISPLDDVVILNMTAQFKTPTWAGYWQFWADPPYRIFMPLTMTVWQAIAFFSYRPQFEPHVWAMAAVGFKAASIVVHVLSAVAATWALAVILRCRWPGIIGGLLFALHPIQVESVCWTTGLKDELYGLFALMSIGFYADYVRREFRPPWASWRWHAAFAAAILSMLSKSAGLMLPLSLAAIDFALRSVPPTRRVPALWLFFLPAAASAAILSSLQSNPAVPLVPLWVRPFVATDTLAFYLGKIAWPLHLSVDYGRQPQVVWHGGDIWLTWIFPAAVLLGLIVTRSRMALLAAALFVIPIIPVLGIVPFDMQRYSTPADHYLYQSMFGVGLLAALILRRIPVHVGISVSAVALASLGVLSWRDCRQWRRPADLFENVLHQNPQSWMARSILATLSLEAGDTAYASRLVQEIMAIKPHYGDAYHTLAVIRFRQAHYREAGEAAETAIALNGKKSSATLCYKLIKCGTILQDRQMAYDGVVAWLDNDPGNPLGIRLRNDLARSLAANPPSRPETAASSEPSTEAK